LFKSSKENVILQTQAVDCGPACGTIIANFCNIEITLNQFKEHCNYSSEGCSLSDIADTLEQLGLQVFAYELTSQECLKLSTPFIAAMRNHFVVVEKIDKNQIYLIDPAYGKIRSTFNHFFQDWQGVCLFAKPHQSILKFDSKKKRTLALFPLLKNFKKTLIICVLISLFCIALGLASSYMTKILFDEILPTKMLNILVNFGIAFGFIIIATQVLETMRHLIFTFVASWLQVDFSMEFYKHLLSIPYLKLLSKGTGDMLSRMRDVAQVRTFVTDFFIEALMNSLFFLGSLIFVSFLSPPMALIAFLLGGFSVFVSVYVSKILYQKRLEIIRINSQSEQTMIEHLYGFLALKCFTAERGSVSTVRQQMEKATRLLLSSVVKTETLDFIVTLVSHISVAAFTLYGAWLVMRGEMTLGTLVSLGALYAMVIDPMEKLAELVSQFQTLKASKARLQEVLAIDPEPQSSTGQTPQDNKIEFKNLYFKYRNDNSKNKWILHDISFAIHKNEVVGLVGPTGSGKTTLSLLINHILDDYTGQILIGGINTRTINTRDLRKFSSIVTQDPNLMAGTVLENIALGELEPNLEKATQAALVAQADSFISELPGQYSFKLGQGGLGLSGGQRQRLAIARALYRDSKILIFDEMTSALDRETERSVLRGMEKVLNGKTVLIISHRLSSLKHCNRILFLSEGRLEGFAPLAELKKNQKFCSLMTDEIY